MEPFNSMSIAQHKHNSTELIRCKEWTKAGYTNMYHTLKHSHHMETDILNKCYRTMVPIPVLVQLNRKPLFKQRF